MTTTRERFVILKRRRTKRGEFREVLIFRPSRDFERTLTGVDPQAPAYQRSLIRAQDDYQRFVAAGRPAKPLRNGKGSELDQFGMALTRPPGGKSEPITEGSIAWLIRQFLVSPQVGSTKPVTRSRYDNLLNRVCRLTWPTPERPGAVVGEFAAETLRGDVMLKIRERFASQPATADKVTKAVSALYNWASRTGLVSCANPTTHIGRLDRSAGHESVSHADYAKLCQRWPLGTMQRLAIDLAVYSGCRVSDLHALGPANLRDGWLYWVEQKGRGSTAIMGRSTSDKQREWPVHPALLESITRTAHGFTTYIVRPNGRSYASPDRLGRAFERWLREAGVLKTRKTGGKASGKTAHGLRKFGATLIADAGGDVLLIKDFLGHSGLAESMIYVAERDRRLAARRAVALMDVEAAAKATA
jgi:integrase